MKRVLCSGILGAAMIAACANCHGQTNIYSLNVGSFFIRFDYHREWWIGPQSDRYGLTAYSIGGQRTLDFWHSKESQGTNYSTQIGLMRLRSKPFWFWISPSLLGALCVAALGFAVPLVAIFSVQKRKRLAAAAT